MLFKKKDITVDSRLSHIAFIMDGNGRWAKKRGMPRKLGHRQGAIAFEKIVKECERVGIKTVTVYAFSTENRQRPKEEIDAIINLLSVYIDKAEKEKNIRFIFLGDKSILDKNLSERMTRLEENTANRPLTLNIAFNYGGRDEIVRACNELICNGKKDITEEDISSHLYTNKSPDPDLIVRTAGEYRLSNFLLWQCAYSEFYFTETLWPDFDEKELHKAIEDFYKRKRNFGKVTEK